MKITSNYKRKISVTLFIIIIAVFSITSCSKPENSQIEHGAILNQVDYTTEDRIAFASYSSGKSQIYIMNSDGTNIKNISENDFNEFGFSWSPDGTKIVFTSSRDGHYQIYLMNSDGSG